MPKFRTIIEEMEYLKEVNSQLLETNKKAFYMLTTFAKNMPNQARLTLKELNRTIKIAERKY